MQTDQLSLTFAALADPTRRAILARLIEIDPATFGHGRTRNLAIEHSDTAFAALITQDAVPADRVAAVSELGTATLLLATSADASRALIPPLSALVLAARSAEGAQS